MADDALTDAEREALTHWWRDHEAGLPDLLSVMQRIARRARAEGARDALNAAADEQGEDHAIEVALGGWAYVAAWLRERAGQHEEQP